MKVIDKALDKERAWVLEIRKIIFQPIIAPFFSKFTFILRMFLLELFMK